MQGTIIHYDELTRCGLLRDETGRTHYFRREDLPENTAVADNLTVQLDVSEENRLLVTPGNGLPEATPEPGLTPARRPETESVAYVAASPVEGPVARGGWFNWPGFLISVAAMIALMLAGNESNPVRGGKTPSLLGSVWGMMATGLLAWVAYLFGSGGRRWLVRGLFWPIGLCSAMAFWMQSCDGFEGDTASDVYLYLLAALFVAAYLLPYRRK